MYFIHESEKAVNIFHITWMKHSYHCFISITSSNISSFDNLCFVLISASSLLVVFNFEIDAVSKCVKRCALIRRALVRYALIRRALERRALLIRVLERRALLGSAH